MTDAFVLEEITDQQLELALTRATEKSGRYLRVCAFDQGSLQMKKPNDPVTEADKGAELAIRKVLEGLAPGNYVGEELGAYDAGRPITYHIDPIDGTKSWVLHDFLCATSIGVEQDGRLIGGIVDDFMSGVSYVNVGNSRYLLYQGRKYPFKQEHALDQVRLSIEDLPELHAPLRQQGYHTFERGGSMALILAQLAAGNYDGLVKKSNGKGNVWDIAGGIALLDPEKFLIADWNGGPFDYKTSRSGMIILKKRIASKLLEDLASIMPEQQGIARLVRQYRA